MRRPAGGREYAFDGIVGPTHNYGGLSLGNVASMSHGGRLSHPRQAALEGLAKMRLVRELGGGQAVLPPQQRPSISALRRLGFTGSDEAVLAGAARDAEHLVRLVSSAASMWTANAATVAPSADTADRRVHLTPANLSTLFHRAIEAETTSRVLGRIFRDPKHFTVHEPLPSTAHFADEGAANHTRLEAGAEAVHLFAWGRQAWGAGRGPRRFPARQTMEASAALARLHRIAPARCLFPQQSVKGIDGGAFHTDVLAVGSGAFLMMHELAFEEPQPLIRTLRRLLGSSLSIIVATDRELPLRHAVAAYPFNSQLVTRADGTMILLAPLESYENAAARRFLERVLVADNPLTDITYVDLRQSMQNGGGPACLRQRIVLTDAEVAAIDARVFFDARLERDLTAWVTRHYRDRLKPGDLRDPTLARENLQALDALTSLLRLGSIYDFQLAGTGRSSRTRAPKK